MEKELKHLIAKARQSFAIWHHRGRHLWDEIREQITAVRPITHESPVDPILKPWSFRLALTTYRAQYLKWRSPILLSLLFLVSLGSGYALKSWAKDSFTIGHEDYRLVPAERLYALNVLRERALASGVQLTAPTKPNYPVCSEDADISVDESGL